MKTRRPSSVIAKQIAEFEAYLPKDYTPSPDDFAAELQLSSWQSHLSELKEEHEQAIDAEMENSDVQIILSGKPVKDHSVNASVLAGILGSAGKLVSALGELGRRAADALLGSGEENDLMVDGVFASSFGLKMRIASEAEGDAGSTKAASLAEQFCGLLDGSTENAKLQVWLSNEKIRSSYLKLMKQIASADAKVFVRTKKTRYGVLTSPRQAQERIEWLSLSAKSQGSITVRGMLVGGSIPSKKFEIMADEKRYAGSVRIKALKQMTEIKFGDQVQALISVVKKSRSGSGSVHDISDGKYHLEHVFVLVDSEKED